MRLINADELKKKAHVEEFDNYLDEYRRSVYLEDIDDAPTIDARPVVCAYWEDGRFCSNCGWFHEDNNGSIEMSFYEYCPGCGARME